MVSDHAHLDLLPLDHNEAVSLGEEYLADEVVHLMTLGVHSL